MAKRVAKCTMGVQDDGQDTYRRDAVSTSVEERPSSQLRSDSQVIEWRTIMRKGTTKPCAYSST